MSDATTLVRRFGAAGLELEVMSSALGRGRGALNEIVQIDISRRHRRERFRVWRGHMNNRIEVQGLDRHLQQLVLLIHEPRRRFEVEVSPWARLAPETRILRTVGRRRWIESWTDGRKRHFLCGMDEAHYFIAQLPRAVSTVREAQEALRNPELERLERQAPSRTIRQGEWFFVSIGPSEEAEVLARDAQGLVRRNIGIAQAARIARLGRPHVADEVLVVRSTNARTPLRIYVRGRVRHPDHETVVFNHWRRVLANTEANVQPLGVNWTD